MSRPALPGQHLSDEAIAAYADGVLGAAPRERALRHLRSCPECSEAVAVQREAVLALRAAPPPPLPSGLLDRLRAVPITTPLPLPSAALDPSGAAVFPAYGTQAAAGPQAEPSDSRQQPRRRLPFGLFTLAAVSMSAGFAAAATQVSDDTDAPTQGPPAAPWSWDVSNPTMSAVQIGVPLPRKH